MTKKIFLVEDEKDILEMYKTKFDSEGYRVSFATNGVDALDGIKKEIPDLVLLDLILPRMNGYQVLHALRQSPATSNLNICILSNLGQAADIERGYKEGANGYFVKALLNPSSLAKKVREMLFV